METPVEFTGTLMLGTQLAYPKNPLLDDLRAFRYNPPGVEDEWLIPFTLDNLPKTNQAGRIPKSGHLFSPRNNPTPIA